MKNWIALCLIAGAVWVQADEVAVPKAGVAFRFDDTKPVGHWEEMAKLFERYGCKLSYAINSQQLTADKNRIACLQAVAAKGHDLMDHLPSHSVYRIQARNQKEFEEYSKLPFADHADPKSKTVYFKYEVDLTLPGTMKFQGEIKNGELVGFSENVKNQLRFTRKIYIPSSKKVYGIQIQKGKKLLRSFWRETVSIPDYKGEMILIAPNRGIQPPDAVLRFLAETAKKNFQTMGLPAPKVWIQPGGWECFVTPEKIRNIYAKEFGYNSADCIPGNNRGRNNAFGDPEPELGRYNMCADFTGMDNGQDVRAMKRNIAEAIAQNKVKVFISHMWVHRVKGGWSSYINGYGELLLWLKKHDIPVKTQTEWADILYSGKSGAFGNILPSLQKDLDEDGKPDGYDLQKGTTVDLKTGVAVIPPGGRLRISDVAGLERNTNRFSIEVKGEKGTVVQVSNFFACRNNKKNYLERRKFRLSGNGWETIKGEVNVKPEAVTLHFGIRAAGKDKTIEVRNPQFKH